MQPGAQVALCPLLPIVEGQDGMARASTGSQRQLCMMPVAIIGPAWLQLERRGLEPRALHAQHHVALPKLAPEEKRVSILPRSAHRPAHCPSWATKPILLPS